MNYAIKNNVAVKKWNKSKWPSGNYFIFRRGLDLWPVAPLNPHLLPSPNLFYLPYTHLINHPTLFVWMGRFGSSKCAVASRRCFLFLLSISHSVSAPPHAPLIIHGTLWRCARLSPSLPLIRFTVLRPKQRHAVDVLPITTIDHADGAHSQQSCFVFGSRYGSKKTTAYMIKWRETSLSSCSLSFISVWHTACAFSCNECLHLDF